MHPDTARQLAAERQADLRRDANAVARPRKRRRFRLRRSAPGRYAGAPAGARTGT
jgi:hypothetical protein